VGPNENLPINCVLWYEAYAFCIWDGGFLPTEAEREFAAAGGSQQREYPWGTIPPGADFEYAIYGCYYPSGSGSCPGESIINIAPVGTAALGAGLWGQLDLAGELSEWSLDWYAPYVDPCVNCAYLTASLGRVARGGDFRNDSTGSLASFARPPGGDLSGRYVDVGIRCARAP
jgi:formylglycine-generating enzyme required for sulfatase activity